MSFFGPRLSLPLLAVAIAVPVASSYQALLADPRGETVALFQIEAWEIGAGGTNAKRLPRLGGPLWIGAGAAGAGGSVSLRYADGLYAGDPDDADVPNVAFAERLRQVRLTRTLPILPGGSARVQVEGEAELENADGGLDPLVARFQVGGREASLRLGRPTDAWADFGLVAGLVAESWTDGTELMRVLLRARDYVLDTALRGDLYAGTGGIEGGDDLTGKPKERTWGPARNVSLTPLNDDLVYSANGGHPINAVEAVYDRGAALTFAGTDYADYAALVAATTGDAGSGADIESGEYATCLALGLVRLGGNPAGRITADLEGDKRGGSYVSSRGAIALRILKTEAGIASALLVESRWSRLTGDVALHLGVDESETTGAVLDRLVGPVGKWGGGPDGRLRVYQLSDPAGRTAVATLTSDDLLSLEPEDWEPPTWRWRVGYDVNWTVQADDLAEGVSPERRRDLAQRQKVASASASLRTDFPDAIEQPEVESLYAEAADAEALAAALLALHRPNETTNEPRRLWRGQLTRPGFAFDLGDPVRVIWPRGGLAGGRTLLVVDWDLDTAGRVVAVEFFG